mgnify:CR=1 FL=1
MKADNLKLILIKNGSNTYAGEEFAIAVQQAIEICDKAAEGTTLENRTRMTEAFIAATQMEYYFWQAAYDLKSWI